MSALEHQRLCSKHEVDHCYRNSYRKSREKMVGRSVYLPLWPQASWTIFPHALETALSKSLLSRSRNLRPLEMHWPLSQVPCGLQWSDSLVAERWVFWPCEPACACSWAVGDFFPIIMTSKTLQVSGSFSSNQIPVQVTTATDAIFLSLKPVLHWSLLYVPPPATGNPTGH